MRDRCHYAALLGMALATVPLFSQGPPHAKPVFDVASVKPSLPGSRQQLAIQPGGRLSVNDFSLEALIAISHHLAAYQMSGVDGWMKADRWSIEAKAEEVTQIPVWSPPFLPEVIAVRLRGVLEDRFSLKAHRETRELKAYTLTIGKGGSKLVEFNPASQSASGQQSSPQSAVPGGLPAGPTAAPGSMAAGPGVIIASAVTMDQLVNYLNKLMDLPVIDKTGLSGRYNFRLRFAPESAHPLSGTPQMDGSTPQATVTDDPSIFVAIQEQLGLNLRMAKEGVEVLVIDSARRPTEN
jgi:bla regulator protein blaR1